MYLIVIKSIYVCTYICMVGNITLMYQVRLLQSLKMGDETEYIKLKVVLSIKDRTQGLHLKAEQ